MTRTTESRRLPALDGLRTLAVLAVFGYHAAPQYVRGGQVGVDVFFVLSGFVITLLLLIERDAAGRPSLRRFYSRRVRRLTPALVAMWIVVECVTLALPAFRSSWATNFWTLLSAMNLYRAITGQGGDALGHTWSLGVEEQFYLIWPLVLLMLIRARVSGQRLLAAVASAALVSTLWASYLNHSVGHWFRIFNAPDTRALQLLAGCGAAVLVGEPQLRGACTKAVRGAEILAWPSLLALVLSAVALRDEVETGTVWQLLLPAVATLVIILASINQDHAFSRVLGFKPLAAAGARYSYAFYLWHYPIIFMLHSRLPPNVLTRVAVYLFLTAIATGLSYRFVERFFSARRV